MALAVRVKGLDALRNLSRSLQDTDRALNACAKVGQEQTLTLIGEGFKQGKDPYGAAWNAPNKLQITGGIRRYARGQTSAGGWTIHATDEKAIWHHNPQPRKKWNGKALPTRLQVPVQGKGLPPDWARRIVAVMEKSLAINLKRLSAAAAAG